MRSKKFFDEYTAQENREATEARERGRSTALIAKRNEKICYRYYYYSRILHLRFEDVMAMLCEDFDLSKSRMGLLIGENAERLREIGQEMPTRERLRGKYPQFDWSKKAAV